MTARTDGQLLLGNSMKNNGDVAWFVAGKEKKITYSTTATKDLIVELIKEYKDLREVIKHIHYDETAKKIVQAYINRGIYEIRVR